MRYYLIAGEPSGDLHGSNLLRGLAKADSQAKFRFWGGDKMAEQGGAENLCKHYRETSFFGFLNVARNICTIMRQFKECYADIEAFKPDVLILIDYPGFNLKVARWAHEHGIKVFYYIAPKVWAWNEKRVKSLKRYVDKLYTIFPFETEYFAKHGIVPHFEGNPLVDAIEQRRSTLPSPAAFRAEHGLDERPIIALVAGSRKTEIKANLPLMVSLSKSVPDRQFIVTGVSWLDRELYSQYLDGSDVRILFDCTYDVLSVSEAAVVTSGTATLETALMGIPEVVVFRIPALHMLLKDLVLRVKWISLVNLNLGFEAVRELIQSSADHTALEQELRAIIEGGDKREKMLSNYAQLSQIIGSEGASERFARAMVEELKK